MKVVFLDIDGVLQPGSHQERFEHRDEIPGLCKRLNEEHPGFDYVKFAGTDKFSNRFMGIGAVYYDWDKTAVELLRKVLDETGARIVLSTDWRAWGMRVMGALLAIHGLDKYLIDMTAMPQPGYTHEAPPGIERCSREFEEWAKPFNDAYYRWQRIFDEMRENVIVDDIDEEFYRNRYTNWTGNVWVDDRTAEILEYLDRHQEITSFVALDDLNLKGGIASHFSWCLGRMKQENYEQCRRILAIEDGPYHLKLKDSYDREILEQWRRETYGPASNQ